jgi:hypothetical protein
MLGIFAAWAVPFAHATGNTLAAAKWASQFSGRLRGEDFKLASWIWNIPRGLVYFLPWTILLPLVRSENFAEEKDRQLVRALAWGAIVPFVVINLLPGSLPRYAMPALVSACWLLAMTLGAEKLAWPDWLGRKSFSLRDRQRTVAGIAIVACLCVAVYAVAIVPRLQRRQNVKKLAAQIDEAVPRSEPLYAIDPNYQPIFFYTRSKLIYAIVLNDLPADAVYLLVRPKSEHAVLESDRWAPRHARLVFQLTDYRNESVALLKIE